MSFENAQPETVVIKKYANRRLYNTMTSSYITLDGLAVMVRSGTDFVVYDARTGEDITRMILTQIIFDEEGRGAQLLPVQFLRDLIRFYGQNMQNLLPNYLDMSMDLFKKNQDRFQKTWETAFSGTSAFKQVEEMMRQNVSLFEKTISLFTPFSKKPAPFEKSSKQAHKNEEQHPEEPSHSKKTPQSKMAQAPSSSKSSNVSKSSKNGKNTSQAKASSSVKKNDQDFSTLEDMKKALEASIIPPSATQQHKKPQQQQQHSQQKENEESSQPSQESKSSHVSLEGKTPPKKASQGQKS
jgi:polyhydroxyalkanoate synthesis repressor PhaR